MSGAGSPQVGLTLVTEAVHSIFLREQERGSVCAFLAEGMDMMKHLHSSSPEGRWCD